jgi:hypothetical protein
MRISAGFAPVSAAAAGAVVALEDVLFAAGAAAGAQALSRTVPMSALASAMRADRVVVMIVFSCVFVDGACVSGAMDQPTGVAGGCKMSRV